MRSNTQIIEIGDSLGILLPEDFVSRFGLKDGDTILAIKEPGGFRLVPQGQGPRA